MRISIIYDNTTRSERLFPDWGFACLIETPEKRILFDTGAKGRLLHYNMEHMEIDPANIDTIFISHDHWDHVDGLAEVLKLNPGATLYVPESYDAPAYTDSVNLVRVKDRTELAPGIWSTGELDGFEQSLVLGDPSALTVVTGCSHPGVGAILEAASEIGTVANLVGGLHDFDDIPVLAPLSRICPTHCTQQIREIKTGYPDKYLPGGVGSHFDFN